MGDSMSEIRKQEVHVILSATHTPPSSCDKLQSCLLREKTICIIYELWNAVLSKICRNVTCNRWKINLQPQIYGYKFYLLKFIKWDLILINSCQSIFIYIYFLILFFKFFKKFLSTTIFLTIFGPMTYSALLTIAHIKIPIHFENISKDVMGFDFSFRKYGCCVMNWLSNWKYFCMKYF